MMLIKHSSPMKLEALYIGLATVANVKHQLKLLLLNVATVILKHQAKVVPPVFEVNTIKVVCFWYFFLKP